MPPYEPTVILQGQTAHSRLVDEAWTLLAREVARRVGVCGPPDRPHLCVADVAAAQLDWDVLGLFWAVSDHADRRRLARAADPMVEMTRVVLEHAGAAPTLDGPVIRLRPAGYGLVLQLAEQYDALRAAFYRDLERKKKKRRGDVMPPAADQPIVQPATAANRPDTPAMTADGPTAASVRRVQHIIPPDEPRRRPPPGVIVDPSRRPTDVLPPDEPRRRPPPGVIVEPSQRPTDVLPPDEPRRWPLGVILPPEPSRRPPPGVIVDPSHRPPGVFVEPSRRPTDVIVDPNRRRADSLTGTPGQSQRQSAPPPRRGAPSRRGPPVATIVAGGCCAQSRGGCRRLPAPPAR